MYGYRKNERYFEIRIDKGFFTGLVQYSRSDTPNRLINCCTNLTKSNYNQKENQQFVKMKVTDKKFLNVHQTISPLTATTVNGKHSDHHNGNSAPTVSSQLAAVINGVAAVNGTPSSAMSPTSVVTISASATTNGIPMQTSPSSISSSSSSLSVASNNQTSVNPKSSS